MDPLTLLGLVGLALVDSTSIGTLVLPLVVLLAPRVHVGRYLVLLGTVAGFDAAVGIVLVLGGGAIASAVDLGDALWLRWVQLVVGVVLLAAGIAGDKVLAWWRGVRGTPRRDRAGGWASRLVGEDASYGTVVAVGLGAALVEVASMLPFLAAAGIIAAAGLPAAGAAGVVVAYAAVMVLPALVLLGARLLAGPRVEAPLARFSAWLGSKTEGAIYWVLAIVGFLVAGDAYGALSAAGAVG